MRRKPVVTILVFLTLLVCFQFPKPQQTRARASDGYPVHNLNTGLNYTTIQDAIDANETLDGQVIHVDAGTYSDRVTIHKSLSLIGESGNKTIIMGNGKLWAVSIVANNVTFSGFTVEQGGRGLNILPNGGIFVVSNNCRIYDNIICDSDNYGEGISVVGDPYSLVSGNLVENNTVTNCYDGIELSAENCELTNNTVTNCTCLGAFVQGSNNILRGNSFSYNRFDFGAQQVQDIDETNLVSGKAIVYWVNQHGMETPANAGYVSCLNCVNITVAGMEAGKVRWGISLVNTTDSVIEDAILSNCSDSCIYLFNSSGNTIANCSLSGGSDLIEMVNSNFNRIDQSIMSGSILAVEMHNTEHTLLTRNSFENNYEGIYIVDCNATSVYHNNFINSSNVHMATYDSNVTLNNGLEGNYWSDYNGTDTDQDGIGNTPYVVDANNIDKYPLMGTFQSYNLSVSNLSPPRFEEVDVISNSTIGSVELESWLTTPNKYFQAGQYYLLFSGVTGEDGTVGFCRVMIPNDVLNTSAYVVLDGMSDQSKVLNVTKLSVSNSTNTYLYFTYSHPISVVVITLPEFQSFLVLLPFMIVTLLAIMVRKRAPQAP